METNKKAQHETLGFVLIIFIVVIIAVIFLGLSLRQKTTIEATDAEISNFLIASSGVTSQCYTNNEPSYRTLGQLIEDCYSPNPDIICPNATSPCKAVNSTYSGMLYRFRPGGIPLSYYSMSFWFNGTGSTELKRITSDISFGSTKGCVVKRAGRNYIYIAGGSVIQELEVCPEA